MFQESKALRKQAASGIGYRAALNAQPSGGSGPHTAVIREYSGAIPADADASVGDAVLLCTYVNGATGLSLADAADVGGQIVMSKSEGETWAGATVGAGGVPSFFRLSEAADVPTNSAGIYCRIQGNSGIGGSFDHTVSGAFLTGGTNTWLTFDYTIASY
jgi:hypothetical protein